jgi:hypothetical protein
MSRSTRCVRAALGALAIVAFAGRAGADPIRVDVDAIHNNFANPVWVSLEAGDYSVTPVGIAGGGAFDAWQPWGDATTCGAPSGCVQTIPTTFVGWKNSYDVLSDALTAVSVSESPLTPVAQEPTNEAFLQDYWLANASVVDRYHVDDGMVYPSAADAFVPAAASVLTVSQAGLVGFAIRDDFPSDNLGGVSLEIAPLPEPAGMPALTLGFAALAIRRRSRRARDASTTDRQPAGNPRD